MVFHLLSLDARRDSSRPTKGALRTVCGAALGQDEGCRGGTFRRERGESLERGDGVRGGSSRTRAGGLHAVSFEGGGGRGGRSATIAMMVAMAAVPTTPIAMFVTNAEVRPRSSSATVSL